MWIPLTFINVLLFWTIRATQFNCTQCESSLGWTDCGLNSIVQPCTDGSFQACFRAELTTLQSTTTTIKSPANSTFRQGCATKPTFCTDWDTAKVAVVRQCSLCPEGTPQGPCSAAGQPLLNAIDEKQVEIDGMGTKHGAGSRVAGGGPNNGGQFLAKGPNGKPMFFVVLNDSKSSTREPWLPKGPPHVIDWQNEPGVYEIFPYGWNETVDNSSVRVGFRVYFTVLMVVISMVAAILVDISR